MPKTLIVYHSRSGYTRRLAQSLAARLDADLEEIRIVQPLDGPLGYVMCAIEAIGGLGPALRPATRDPAKYDLVVVGTPVWFWSLASPVRSWLEQHPLARATIRVLLHDGWLRGVVRVFHDEGVGGRRSDRHTRADRRRSGWVRARKGRRLHPHPQDRPTACGQDDDDCRTVDCLKRDL